MKFTLGRMGSEIGGNVSRRGATAEDIQFLLKEMQKVHGDKLNWLNQHFGGKYTLDFVPSFSTAGGAFHVVISLANVLDAKELDEKIKNENITFIKPYIVGKKV